MDRTLGEPVFPKFLICRLLGRWSQVLGMLEQGGRSFGAVSMLVEEAVSSEPNCGVVWSDVWISIGRQAAEHT